MGSLMPVGGGPDAEIIATLNNLFSGSNLNALRGHEGLTGENLFDRHHKLRRVAFRIGAYPARDYSPDDAKRKWFYFLDKVLPAATENAIKRILKDAIRPDSPITAVQFFVEENASVSKPHLFPPNNSPLSDFLDPKNAQHYWVRLVVKMPMEDEGEDPPDQQSDHDVDDNGNDIERPISWPSFRLRKSARGKSSKKSSKKSTKKSSKK